jgi:hypothetical protein
VHVDKGKHMIETVVTVVLLGAGAICINAVIMLVLFKWWNK